VKINRINVALIQVVFSCCIVATWLNPIFGLVVWAAAISYFAAGFDSIIVRFNFS